MHTRKLCLNIKIDILDKLLECKRWCIIDWKESYLIEAEQHAKMKKIVFSTHKQFDVVTILQLVSGAERDSHIISTTLRQIMSIENVTQHFISTTLHSPLIESSIFMTIFWVENYFSSFKFRTSNYFSDSCMINDIVFTEFALVRSPSVSFDIITVFIIFEFHLNRIKTSNWITEFRFQVTNWNVIIFKNLHEHKWSEAQMNRCRMIRLHSYLTFCLCMSLLVSYSLDNNKGIPIKITLNY